MKLSDLLPDFSWMSTNAKLVAIGIWSLIVSVVHFTTLLVNFYQNTHELPIIIKAILFIDFLLIISSVLLLCGVCVGPKMLTGLWFFATIAFTFICAIQVLILLCFWCTIETGFLIIVVLVNVGLLRSFSDLNKNLKYERKINRVESCRNITISRSTETPLVPTCVQPTAPVYSQPQPRSENGPNERDIEEPPPSYEQAVSLPFNPDFSPDQAFEDLTNLPKNHA